MCGMWGKCINQPVFDIREFIMKKLLIPLIAGLTLGNALPTWAGPDWQAIESARKAKQARQVARRSDAVAPKLLQVLRRARRTPR